MGRQIELHMYECRYHPASRSGVPIPNETGNLPSVPIAARNQAEAEKQAFRQVGHPIVETLRLVGVLVPKMPAVKRVRKSRKPDLAALGLVTAASLLPKEPS